MYDIICYILYINLTYLMCVNVGPGSCWCDKAANQLYVDSKNRAKGRCGGRRCQKVCLGIR